MKPEIRFNGGRGAVLCEQCRIIVEQNLTKLQWDVLENLDVPCYCQKCDKEKNWQFEHAYMNKVQELFDLELPKLTDEELLES